MNKKLDESLGGIEHDLRSIVHELGRVKEAIFGCKNEIIRETESLRRILAVPEREEENEYHKAMSKSALGTAIKLKALVEYLDLIYFPEGETKTHHKAHFKLSPHMMKKGDKK